MSIIPNRGRRQNDEGPTGDVASLISSGRARGTREPFAFETLQMLRSAQALMPAQQVFYGPNYGEWASPLRLEAGGPSLRVSPEFNTPQTIVGDPRFIRPLLPLKTSPVFIAHHCLNSTPFFLDSRGRGTFHLGLDLYLPFDSYVWLPFPMLVSVRESSRVGLAPEVFVTGELLVPVTSEETIEFLRRGSLLEAANSNVLSSLDSEQPSWAGKWRGFNERGLLWEENSETIMRNPQRNQEGLRQQIESQGFIDPEQYIRRRRVERAQSWSSWFRTGVYFKFMHIEKSSFERVTPLKLNDRDVILNASPDRPIPLGFLADHTSTAPHLHLEVVHNNPNNSSDVRTTGQDDPLTVLDCEQLLYPSGIYSSSERQALRVRNWTREGAEGKSWRTSRDERGRKTQFSASDFSTGVFTRPSMFLGLSADNERRARRNIAPRWSGSEDQDNRAFGSISYKRPTRPNAQATEQDPETNLFMSLAAGYVNGAGPLFATLNFPDDYSGTAPSRELREAIREQDRRVNREESERRRLQDERARVARRELRGELGKFRANLVTYIHERIEELYRGPIIGDDAQRAADPWMWDFIQAHRKEDGTGVDPFAPENLGGAPFWDASGGSQWASLGRVFGFFVGIPLAKGAANGRDDVAYDEVQVFWHRFNSDASWYANQSICNFMIEKGELKAVLRDLFERRGATIPLAAFLNAVNTEIIRNTNSRSWTPQSFFTPDTEPEEGESRFASGLRAIRGATQITSGFSAPRGQDETLPRSRRLTSSLRENSSLYTRQRTDLLRRAYSRFEDSQSAPSLEFRPPNITLSMKMVPMLSESGDGSLIAESNRSIARATILDTVAGRWTSLAKILQAARYNDARILRLGDLERADDDALQDEARSIARAILDDLGRQDGALLTRNGESITLNGGLSRIKRLYRIAMPTLIWDGEGSVATNASYTTIGNGGLNTIFLQRSLSGRGLNPAQDANSNLPMRVSPAQISIDMLGFPFLGYSQHLFMDFNTGTTLDNIYAATQTTHSIDSSGFKTSFTAIPPTDAYGTMETALTSLQRAVEMVEMQGDITNED